MTVNNESFKGWPFVNHAMNLRNTQSPEGPSRETIVYPRRKYTYLIEFRINPYALIANQTQTDVLKHLKNGRVYASLRSIDHPRINFETETLRSYNKYVTVKTKTEFVPINLSFHDDNSSVVMALWKEYLAFYSHAGDIGRGSIQNPQLDQNGEFRLGNRLVDDEMRANMDIHPSVGMTLRPNNKRHFFDSIAIYDLGSDPDSINVYHLIHPTISAFDQDALDYYDRDGHLGVTWSMQYENYYFNVGINASQIREVIEGFLDFFPETPPFSVQGHAESILPNQGSNPKFPVDEFSTNTGSSPIIDDDRSVTQNPSVQPGDSPTEGTIPRVGGPSALEQPFPDNLEDSQALLDRLNALAETTDPNVPAFIRRQASIQAIRVIRHMNEIRSRLRDETSGTLRDATERTQTQLGGGAPEVSPVVENANNQEAREQAQRNLERTNQIILVARENQVLTQQRINEADRSGVGSDVIDALQGELIRFQNAEQDAIISNEQARAVLGN